MPTKKLSKQCEVPKIVIVSDGSIKMNMTKEQKKSCCGTDNAEIPGELLSQLFRSIPHMSHDEQGESKANAAIAMLSEIAPQDGLEGMLAAQMVAVHYLSLECANRSMLSEQTVDGVNNNINRVTKLMRTFTAQMEALQRYRNGGKQTISVQHVNVEDGGQAIVGNVTGGGGNG